MTTTPLTEASRSGVVAVLGRTTWKIVRTSLYRRVSILDVVISLLTVLIITTGWIINPMIIRRRKPNHSKLFLSGLIRVGLQV